MFSEFSLLGSFPTYLAHSSQFFFQFHCCVNISHSLRSPQFDGFVSISRTLYSLFSSIVVLVSRGLLEFSSVHPFRQYLVHLEHYVEFGFSVIILHTPRILFSAIVSLVSCAFVELSLLVCCVSTLKVQCVSTLKVQSFLQYLAHSQNSLLFNPFVSILRTLRILFSSILSLVSCALLKFFILQSFRQYLALSQKSFQLNPFVSILRTLRILYSSVLSLVSCALLEFFIVQFFRYYLSLSQNLLQFDYFVSIARTPRILSREIVLLVFRAF